MSQQQQNRFGAVSPTLLMGLDAVRFFLAIYVVVTHWLLHHFQDQFQNESLITFGFAAVGGFFVMSGFTIRMLSPDRESFQARHYVVERWSRLLSVVVPALVIGGAFDFISYIINPDYFIGPILFGEYDPITRIVANLFGVSQVWGHDVEPFSNSPFWSLSYEAGFYAVYGLYMAGRPWLAALLLIVLGPNVALVMVLWLGGALVYDLFCRSPEEAKSARRALLALAVVLGAIALALLFQQFDGMWKIHRVFEIMGISTARVNAELIVGSLGFIAALAACTWACQRYCPTWRVKWLARSFRYLGSVTFPLYLFHLPIFVLLAAANVYDRGSLLHVITIPVEVIFAILLIVPFTDWFRIRLRDAFNRIGQKSQQGQRASSLPARADRR